MQMNHGLPLLLGCALALGSACAGQDGADASPGGDSGALTLQPEAVVAELSASDGVAFCEMAVDLLETHDAMETNPTLACTKEGLFARFMSEEAEVATCEAARDSCLEEAGDGQDAPAPLDCASELELESCDITLAEFDTCRLAVEALFELALTTATCDMAAEKALELRATMSQGRPVECTPLTERCPLFAGLEWGME